MKRRDFIKSSCSACVAMSIGLLSGASFLESCGSARLTVIKASANSSGKVSVSRFDLQGNKAQMLRVAGYPFDIAVKQHEESYLAIVMMCTHAGHPLVKSGEGYYCTLHGSRFKGDGKVQTGPASKSLMHLPVEAQDDQLLITLLKPVY